MTDSNCIQNLHLLLNGGMALEYHSLVSNDGMALGYHSLVSNGGMTLGYHSLVSNDGMTLGYHSLVSNGGMTLGYYSLQGETILFVQLQMHMYTATDMHIGSSPPYGRTSRVWDSLLVMKSVCAGGRGFAPWPGNTKESFSSNQETGKVFSPEMPFYYKF